MWRCRCGRRHSFQDRRSRARSLLAIMISYLGRLQKKEKARPKPRLLLCCQLTLCGVRRTVLRVLVGCYLQSCLCLNGKSSKTGSIVGGDIGENLAVEAVAGKFKAVDKGRVAHAVDPAGCVDADDPERAELSLLLFASGVGELERALDGLLRSLVELGFSEEVTTRALQDLFAAVVAFCTPFDTGHRVSPFAYLV